MDSATRQRELPAEPFRSAPGAQVRVGRAGRHPLLGMSIGSRLTLGFLIPILVIFLALLSIGLQSSQLLGNVSTFNRHLLHAYTSLSTAVGTLQQTHINLLGALNDA